MTAELPAAARRAIEHVARSSHGGPLTGAERVCLHFHPDRRWDGVPIPLSMARDGVYRSQFETGIGNGGLTAHPGGDRWRWESRIFGGAYDAEPAGARPKYGALDFRGTSADPRSGGGSGVAGSRTGPESRSAASSGPAPRFGSAHLRLRRDVLRRTTFCYPDSVFEPQDFGVAERMPLRPSGKFEPLDDYVEAHVHGSVRIDRDVEALVLDPCYRGTEIERQVGELGCAVEWHGGFRLSTAELQAHPDYRGPRIVEIGLEIAAGGWLDARVIGEAVHADRHDPQDLKKVWHHVARFGAAPGR